MKSFVSCALILAISSGCQIDYPMSQDFPNESAPIEVGMTTEARLAVQDGELAIIKSHSGFHNQYYSPQYSPELYEWLGEPVREN